MLIYIECAAKAEGRIGRGSMWHRDSVTWKPDEGEDGWRCWLTSKLQCIQKRTQAYGGTVAALSLDANGIEMSSFGIAEPTSMSYSCHT